MIFSCMSQESQETSIALVVWYRIMDVAGETDLQAPILKKLRKQYFKKHNPGNSTVGLQRGESKKLWRSFVGTKYFYKKRKIEEFMLSYFATNYHQKSRIWAYNTRTGKKMMI